MLGDCTLTGNVKGVHTILVNGDPSGNASLSSPSSFTNEGTITLEANCDATLTVDGTLFNEGELSVNTGGARTIDASIDNSGTVLIDANTEFSKDNATYSNTGAGKFIVTFGNMLRITGEDSSFYQGGQEMKLNGNLEWTGPRGVFNMTGGQLDINGGFKISNGTFNYNGGALEGMSPPILILEDSTLSLGLAGTSEAVFEMLGDCTLTGNIKGVHTILVNGNPSGNASLSSPSSFTNEGTITLEANCDATLTVDGTLFNKGELSVNTGGARTINASIDNSGTVLIDANTEFSKDNATYSNTGTFTVASGKILTITGDESEFNQNSGKTRLVGNLGWTGQGYTFNLNNGQLTLFTNARFEMFGGIFKLEHGMLNVNPNARFYLSGTFYLNGGELSTYAGSELNIVGDYHQLSDGTLSVELSGLIANTEDEVLGVSDSATLLGTLNVSVASGFTPSFGDTFTILTSSSLINTFETVNTPALSGELIWDTSYDDNSVALSVSQQAENLPPVADAGIDQTVEQDSPGGASVTLDGSGSSDPDTDPLTYSWSWSGGSTTGVNPTIPLPPGTTTVTLVVNDGIVDSDPDTVDITVQDTTPPSITCPDDMTLECPADSSPGATGEATGSDACGDVTISNSDAITPGCGNTETIVRTWTATDEYGNATSCDQTIMVQDTTEPMLTVPVNVTIEQQTTAGTVVPLTASAADNCDDDVDITSDELSIYAVGTTTVTFTATDDCNNSTTASMTVTVLGPQGIKENVKSCLADYVDESRRFGKAIKEIDQSLNPRYWVDETHLDEKHGNKVFDEEKHAVKELMHLLKCSGITSMTLEYTGGAGVEFTLHKKGKSKGPIVDNGDGTYTVLPEGKKDKLSASTKIYLDGEEVANIHTSGSKAIEAGDIYGDFTIIDLEKVFNDNVSAAALACAEAAIETLVRVDRILAETLIWDAAATTIQDPQKQDKVDKELTKALEELVKGDAERDDGDFDKAIDHYKKSWQHAGHALNEASMAPKVKKGKK